MFSIVKPAACRWRRGIALIVTLGLLAALLILVLGFATFMRIERLSAGNFVHLVQTRQLVFAALDTVIDEINTVHAPGTKWAYPSNWYYEASTQDAKDLVFGTSGRGGTKHFLPLEFLEHLGTNPGYPSANLDVDWRPLQDGSVLRGLYAAMIVDESSRLDLNYAGGARYSSTNQRNQAEHLYISDAFTNIADGSDWQQIVHVRTNAVRFYNPAEAKYTVGAHFFGNRGAGPNWINDAHFTTYSRYAQLYASGGSLNHGRVLITGDVAELSARQREILRAFNDADIAAPQDQALFDALLDYVDADDVVRGGPLGYTTEAVPMFSEIIVSNVLDHAAGQVENRVWLGIELAFPFVGHPGIPKTYQLQVRATYEGMDPSDLNVGPILINEPVRLRGEAFFVQWSPEYSATATNLISAEAARLRIQEARLTLDAAVGGGRVDELPADGQITLDVGTEFGSGASLPAKVVGSVEVEDPRINAEGSDWVPDLASHTAGMMNDSFGVPGSDAGAIYVANKPLRNVGELGYLGIGVGPGGAPPTPWESVDLLGVHSKLLDTLTVHRNRYVHGLANLNSDDATTLAAALYGARNEMYPGGATNALNWSQATRLAVEIAAARPPHGYPSRGAMTAISAFYDGTAGLGAQDHENQRESLIRTTADLLDVRGNTHLIVLAVRAVRDRSDATDDAPNGQWDIDHDPVLGEQFAVAQVWRDPVTQQSQVTFFKWIARTD